MWKLIFYNYKYNKIKRQKSSSNEKKYIKNKFNYRWYAFIIFVLFRPLPLHTVSSWGDVCKEREREVSQNKVDLKWWKERSSPQNKAKLKNEKYEEGDKKFFYFLLVNRENEWKYRKKNRENFPFFYF